MKLVQNSSTVERRFSSWIGGSILASLVSSAQFSGVHMIVSTLQHAHNA